MEFINLTNEQKSEMDKTILPTIEQGKGVGAKMMQLATDATRVISMGVDTFSKVRETGLFQRLAQLLPTSKKTQMLNALQTQMTGVQMRMNELVSKEDFEMLQQYAWRAIESLNERNLLTADAVITVKNNLNQLAIDQKDVKEAVTQMAKNVAKRFERMENIVGTLSDRTNGLESRMGNVESRVGKLEVRMDKIEGRVGKIEVRMDTVENGVNTLGDNLGKVAERLDAVGTKMYGIEDVQLLETWIANLPYEDWEERYAPAIRFLKVVKGFFLRKQSDYSIDVIKSFRRALKSVGLDPKSSITLGKFLDDLIMELQDFDENEYLEITKVELDDGRVPSGLEMSKVLSVPSFVSVCWLPASKRDLEDTISLFQTEFNVPYVSALQKAVKQRISTRNGIDLSTETTLFDLGVELISCYSAIPKLMDNPTAPIMNIMTKKALFCSNCGAKTSGDSSFCPNCGQPLN